MSEKSKRKNLPPIPRYFGWIFGTLAILLLVTLPFPVSVIENPQVALNCYGLWSMISFVGLAVFSSRYGFRRKITGLFFAVMLLFILHTFSAFGTALVDGIGEQECVSDEKPTFRTYDCYVEWYYDINFHMMYVTIGDLPVGIKTLDKQVEHTYLEERFNLENRYP